MHNHVKSKPYLLLAVMSTLSFALMYLFMYSMVDAWDNVYANVNQLYMAGLMVSPMVILEVLLMKQMYESRLWNGLIIGASIILALLFWTGIRQQATIGDEGFLRSMIPHHAGAILMCRESSLSDPEIKELCESIVSGQQAEIDFMRAKLKSIQ